MSDSVDKWWVEADTVGRHKSTTPADALSEDDTLFGAKLEAAPGAQAQKKLDSHQKPINYRGVNEYIF